MPLATPQIDLTKIFFDAWRNLSLSVQMIVGCSISIIAFFKVRDFFMGGGGGRTTEADLERHRARVDIARIKGDGTGFWKADRDFKNACKQYYRGANKRRHRGGF